MKFKNELEERVFEAARGICGSNVVVEHNKEVQIERADGIEVASFVGPPKKEVDVITAAMQPRVKVLISCKQYGSKAEPSVVQEWGAVVHAMNRYSAGTSYLGLIVCPSGFTKGCEPWATSHNLGLIPPLKGKKTDFHIATSIQMTGRALGALSKRLGFPYNDLFHPPQFYDFVFDLTADFEGRENEVTERGPRYTLLGTGWLSSFGELVSSLMGKSILEVIATEECLGVQLSDDLCFLSFGNRFMFGRRSGFAVPGAPLIPECRKNFRNDSCSFEFVQELVRGQQLRSAGDFGRHFEFGLSNDINFGFHPRSLHVVRTLSPPQQHLL